MTKKNLDFESHQDAELFKTIVEGQPEGVIVIDQDMTVRYANPAAQVLLDCRLEELEGKAWQWPLDLNKSVEVDIACTEGKTRVLIIKFVPTKWNGSQVYVGSLQDVTEQRREEDLLRQAVDAADTRTSELEAVKFVADQLNQVAMLEDAIQAGLDTILALVRAEAVWVLLLEENENKRLVVIYGSDSLLRSEKRSLGPEFKNQCLDDLLSGELLEYKWFSDPVGLEKAGLSKKLPDKHLCFPLKVKSEVLGILNISVSESVDLSEDELFMLRGISYQLAVAISRTRTYTKAVEALKYEESMSSISRTISSALDLPTVLQNIVRMAVDLTDAEAGSLGLVTPNGEYLTFLSNYPEDVAQQSLAKDDDPVWNMINTQRPRLIQAAEISSLDLPPGFAQDSCSIILVPVLASGETLGALVLYTTKEGKDLSRFDMALVESLGQQAGIAVQNAQLFFEVQQLTISDSLTGVNNQKSFINLAMKELERAWRYKRSLSVLSLVLDDLRAINEEDGQEAGDRALQMVAQCFKDNLRRVDVIGRYEGNNFVVLLPETNPEYATEVAKRILKKIRQNPIKTEKGDIPVRVSMGIASLQENEMIDLDVLIDRANHALYLSVQAGGDRISSWHPTL